MNDDFKISASAPADPEMPTMGMSSVYRLFEAFIALREKNGREHKMFEQTLNRARDSLQSSFNTFAGDTQKAYQQLRQDVLGEKKFSLTLLNVILDLGIEMNHILESKPKKLPDGSEAKRSRIGSRLWKFRIARFGTTFASLASFRMKPRLASPTIRRCTSASAACALTDCPR
jgi:hypothetical protein